MNKALSPLPALDVTPSAAALALVAGWHRALALQVGGDDLSPDTSYVYKTGLAKLMDWVQARGYVSEDLIREWLADLRTAYEPSAIATWFAGVRHFFTWAHGRGLLPYNPTDGIQRGRRQTANKKHRREQLTDAEVLRVLAAPDLSTPAGKRDKAILALMAYTAARTIEVYRATLADLKTDSGKLVLWVRGKGHAGADEMLVLANPDAESAMRDWLAERGDKPGPLFTSLSRRSMGQALARSSLRAMVKRYFRLAGVHGDFKTTHSLRHTAITNAIRHGAQVQKVQAMARHSNIATTMIYYHEVDRVENPAEQFIKYGE